MTNQSLPQLLPISQCDTKILRSPLTNKEHSHLPGFAINQIVITGFEQNFVLNHDSKNFDEESLALLIGSWLQGISFIEAAQFWRATQPLGWIPQKLVLQNCGFRPNEQWQTLAILALNLPLSFQAWLRDKKVSPQELMVLQSAKNLDLNLFADALVANSCSRAMGIQALELFVELRLMNHAESELLPAPGQDPQLWISELRLKRYPQTHKKDQHHRKIVETLAWPKYTEAKWIRQGDQAGLELKLFVTNKAELNRSISSLEQIQNLLKNDAAELWAERQ